MGKKNINDLGKKVSLSAHWSFACRSRWAKYIFASSNNWKKYVQLDVLHPVSHSYHFSREEAESMIEIT